MPGTAVAPASCSERTSLLNQLDAASHELRVIQDEQVKAIVRGNLGANDVNQARLQRARKHKDLLVARLLHHVREHGCSTGI